MHNPSANPFFRKPTAVKCDIGNFDGSYPEFLCEISLRRERIERELKEFGARGVIIGGTTNCPYIAREMEYEYFTKKGVPVLVLDGTAHNDPATEEQKMKLRAFIEIMI